jgi:hypothetical protein
VTGLTREGAALNYQSVQETGTGHTNGHADVRVPGPAPTQTVRTASNGHVDDDADGTASTHLESKALKIRRWEVREEPFEGFNSPPGRF